MKSEDLVNEKACCSRGRDSFVFLAFRSGASYIVSLFRQSVNNDHNHIVAIGFGQWSNEINRDIDPRGIRDW
jgi:hypothetical protein